MPEIDAFLGLAFYMYYYDNNQHAQPHVHVKYGSYELVVAIETGEYLQGYLPSKQRKRAVKHISEHRSKLLNMWQQAITGQQLDKLR